VLIETIPAALHEQRLDRVVALIADISRATTSTLIELGGVTLDGVAGVAGKVKDNQNLMCHQQLQRL
jgi:RNA-binding protein YlmH